MRLIYIAVIGVLAVALAGCERQVVVVHKYEAQQDYRSESRRVIHRPRHYAASQDDGYSGNTSERYHAQIYSRPVGHPVGGYPPRRPARHGMHSQGGMYGGYGYRERRYEERRFYRRRFQAPPRVERRLEPTVDCDAMGGERVFRPEKGRWSCRVRRY